MEKTIKVDPNKRECRHCKFFDTVTNIESHNQISVCRARSPAATAQLIMSPPQMDPVTGKVSQSSPQWTTFTLWPVVGQTDWCGEFVRSMEGMH